MVEFQKENQSLADKASGKAKYTDDLLDETYLSGYPIGAPIAKGLLNKIVFDPNYIWSDFTIITNDFLQEQGLQKAFRHDEPILVDKEISYFGQPILLLAHADIKKIKDAAKHITFDIEEIVPNLQAQITDSIPQDTLFAEKTITKGDIIQGFNEAEQILEGTYSTQAQEHYYLETQITTAKYNEASKTLIVKGSMQAPFNIKNSLTTIFASKVKEVEVIPLLSGGAFGGREDYEKIYR